MLTATLLAGALNYLANMTMGRMLGPAEYSTYAVLLVLHTTLMTLAGVPQMIATSCAARLAALNNLAGLRSLALRLLGWLAPLALFAGALLFLGAGGIARVLQVPTPEPVRALAVAVVPMALAPVGLGLTRGLQRFGAFGGAQIISALLRLVSGALLVLLGLGATGAVLSLLFAVLGIVVVTSVNLSELWHNGMERTDVSADMTRRLVLFATLGMISYTSLTSMDLLIVKTRFPAREAGLYAAVSAVGKIALWIPGALTALLLPKVSARRAAGRDTVCLLRTIQGAALALCGTATVVFFLAAPLVMRILFGEQYVVLAPLLGTYGVAVTFYALVGIWFNYFLAMEQTRYLAGMIVGSLGQAIVLYQFAAKPITVVIGMIVCGGGLFLTGEILFYIQHNLRGRK